MCGAGHVTCIPIPAALVAFQIYANRQLQKDRGCVGNDCNDCEFKGACLRRAAVRCLYYVDTLPHGLENLCESARCAVVLVDNERAVKGRNCLWDYLGVGLLIHSYTQVLHTGVSRIPRCRDAHNHTRDCGRTATQSLLTMNSQERAAKDICYSLTVDQ